MSWLAVGALALGTGIWAMHFIGMLAFSLPCHVNYDPWITVLSMLPGIVASGIALWAPLLIRIQVAQKQSY
jgi:NO-binding membrane sensor protein with MHYT domain